MVELKHITKIFNRSRPDEFTALADVSLLVEARKVTVFKGPSGSGKTTLLSIVGAMARPTSGRVFMDGREITSLPERFLTTIRRKTFGFIFQQFHLIRGISALENVMLPAYTTGERNAALRERALRLLDIFGLAAKARARVEWLSGGEAQRVAIARALVNDPAVVIADEPTAHLDTKLSMDFLGIMERLNAEGKSILIASHDPLIYESALVDRVVEMRDGRVREPGAGGMILHPAVIALLTGSLLVNLMIAYASFWGWRIIDGWDLQSGSESQIALEKKTYLVSTLMAYAFGFQILSFFLFVFTADNLHRLFVGAMCAAGTLNVNDSGYPAMVLKVMNCLLAGVWLVLNHADSRAADYPLTRKKYALLLAIVPFLLLEAEQLWSYFLDLKANVITSCCGSLFSTEQEGVAAALAALPVMPMQAAFFALMAVTLLSGSFFLLRGKCGKLFAVSGTLAFPVSVAALIAFIALYFYELPTHHCPFCILQREYHYVGYPIYASILGGGIASAGVWALMPFRAVPSLKEALPRIQRRLAGAAFLFYAGFTALAIGRMAFSDFILTGY